MSSQTKPRAIAPVSPLTLSRRDVLIAGGALVGAAVGCSPGSVGSTGLAGDDGSDVDPPPGDDVAAANQAPVWTPIPDQVWTIGVPVYLDLADYCTDPDLDTLAYELDAALPAGVTRVGSVISGTPTTALAATTYVATADDGRA